jgi:predicted nucleic acid-binding protein
MTDDEIDSFVNALQIAGLTVDPTAAITNVAADPDDDAIIATAVSSNATYLCTRDKHVRTPEVLAYCHGRGIEVVSDIELLNSLRQVSRPAFPEALPDTPKPESKGDGRA